jgi:hypothetical protein
MCFVLPVFGAADEIVSRWQCPLGGRKIKSANNGVVRRTHK